MKIELINWKTEVNGQLILIDYKVNEHFRSIYVREIEVEKVMIKLLSKHGVNQENIKDFMKGQDVKYIFDDSHKILFIRNFHNV